VRYAVVIPVYNEAGLFPLMLARLDATPPLVAPDGRPLERLLVVVDDFSTDATRELVRGLRGRPDTRVVLHDRNSGKGAAVRSGFEAARAARCDLALIQDADLEYDPADHDRLARPILDGRADAVLGSRFLGETHRVLYYWHYAANRLITTLSNMLSNLNLTDIECGLKAFSGPVLERLTIREDRFGVEPELVARLARLRLPRDAGPPADRPARIFEVPVSYAGRTYEEGKKITWRDGLHAVACIVRYNLSR